MRIPSYLPQDDEVPVTEHHRKVNGLTKRHLEGLLLNLGRKCSSTLGFLTGLQLQAPSLKLQPNPPIPCPTSPTGPRPSLEAMGQPLRLRLHRQLTIPLAKGRHLPPRARPPPAHRRPPRTPRPPKARRFTAGHRGSPRPPQAASADERRPAQTSPANEKTGRDGV